MAIHFTVDDTKFQLLLKDVQTEVPRATRNAMNDTMREAQTAQRKYQLATYHVTRKSYIDQSVKISRFAKYGEMSAEIEIDPNKDILSRHEEGGDYGSYTGKRTVAVPGRAIRSGKGGGVKRGMALKNFTPFTMASPLNQWSLGGSVGGLRRGRGFVGARNTKARLVGQGGTFFMTLSTSNGTVPALVRRKGTGRNKGQLEVLYMFFPKKRIPRGLNFEKNIIGVIESRFEHHASLAVHHALRREMERVIERG